MYQPEMSMAGLHDEMRGGNGATSLSRGVADLTPIVHVHRLAAMLADDPHRNIVDGRARVRLGPKASTRRDFGIGPSSGVSTIAHARGCVRSRRVSVRYANRRRRSTTASAISTMSMCSTCARSRIIEIASSAMRPAWTDTIPDACRTLARSSGKCRCDRSLPG